MPSIESLCLETEKTHECAEKHEDTMKDVKKQDCKGVRVERPVLGVGTRQFLGWSPFFNVTPFSSPGVT